MAWSLESFALAIALVAQGPFASCRVESQQPQHSVHEVRPNEIVALSSSAIKITSLDLDLATCCSGEPVQFSLAANDGHVLIASTIGVDRQLVGFDDNQG